MREKLELCTHHTNKFLCDLMVRIRNNFEHLLSSIRRVSLHVLSVIHLTVQVVVGPVGLMELD